jgi:hypothetical protein
MAPGRPPANGEERAMNLQTALPVLVVDEPGIGVLIRSLCGAESAVIRPALAAARAPARASTDPSPAAVILMVAHAKACGRCQTLMEELRTAQDRAPAPCRRAAAR